MESLAVFGFDSILRQIVGDILQPTLALLVQIKYLFQDNGVFLVDMDSLGARVVQVAKRCTGRIFATPDFLAETSLGVFGKRIHIVFALSKGDIEHELTLWRWLKPKCWELQRHNPPTIEEIDNFSAIDRVSGETIWIPTNYPIRLSTLQPCNHIIE